MVCKRLVRRDALLRIKKMPTWREKSDDILKVLRTKSAVS